MITGKRSLSGTNIGISNSRSPEDAAEPRGLRTSQGRKTDSFSYISGSSALRLDPSALHPALRGVRRGRRAPSEPLAGPGISSSAPTRTPQGGGAGKLESIELSISRSKELRNTLFSIGGPYINWLIDAQSPQDHRSAGVQHESGAHRADPESNWATSGGVWGSAMSGKPYNGINGNPEYWYFKLNPETLRKSSAKFSPANLRKGYLNNLWLRHLNNTKISSNWENNNWTDAKRLLTQRYNWESL